MHVPTDIFWANLTRFSLQGCVSRFFFCGREPGTAIEAQANNRRHWTGEECSHRLASALFVLCGKRKVFRVGPSCETWPNTLPEIPLRVLKLAHNLGQPCTTFVSGRLNGARKYCARATTTNTERFWRNGMDGCGGFTVAVRNRPPMFYR